MATAVHIPATKATKGIPMTSTRKTALVAGVFYLITFISIPTLAIYRPVLNHQDWITGSGGHTGVLVGGFLEVIVALAGIGTAVTLYPGNREEEDEKPADRARGQEHGERWEPARRSGCRPNRPSGR